MSDVRHTWATSSPVKLYRHVSPTAFYAVPKPKLKFNRPSSSSSNSNSNSNSIFISNSLFYYHSRNSASIFPVPIARIPRSSSPSPSPSADSMGSAAKLTAKNEPHRIPVEAIAILKSLAAQWDDITDADADALQVVPLKGAMTNEVYQIKWLTNSNPDESLPRSRKLLVRIYGAGVEIFFDRENEIRTFEFMSKQGQGPRLLGRFANGRIEEFIRARTLTAADLRDPEISALIAAKMKEFHNLDMPEPKKVALWDRLRNWLKEAKLLSTPEEAEAFRLNVMGDEISALEKHLSTSRQLVGFCHNDLQYGNIMMDEETRVITIIDYEYASYNHVAFDIANHFCEMAADYHTETPHVLDYSKYPGLEERQRFLRIYLNGAGNQPSNTEVELLLQNVEKYTLASHLLWGLWGIISEHVNKIDFDYKEYARQRFEQYWSTKSGLVKLSTSKKP